MKNYKEFMMEAIDEKEMKRQKKRETEAKIGFVLVNKELKKFKEYKKHIKSKKGIQLSWAQDYTDIMDWEDFFNSLDIFEDSLKELLDGLKFNMK